MTGSRKKNKPKHPNQKQPAALRASRLQRVQDQNRKACDELSGWHYGLHEWENSQQQRDRMKCRACVVKRSCECAPPDGGSGLPIAVGSSGTSGLSTPGLWGLYDEDGNGEEEEGSVMKPVAKAAGLWDGGNVAVRESVTLVEPEGSMESDTHSPDISVVATLAVTDDATAVVAEEATSVASSPAPNDDAQQGVDSESPAAVEPALSAGDSPPQDTPSNQTDEATPSTARSGWWPSWRRQ